LQLERIGFDVWKNGIKILEEAHMTFSKFGLHEGADAFEDGVDVGGLEVEADGANGLEELFDDAAEAIEFFAEDLGAVLEAGHLGGIGEFGGAGEFPATLLKELGMDAEAVQGVFDFVGDTGSEGGKGAEAFQLLLFGSTAMGIGLVLKEPDTVGYSPVFGFEGYNVERIDAWSGGADGDFEIPDGFSIALKLIDPKLKGLNAEQSPQGLTQDLLFSQPEETEDCLIGVADFEVMIGENNPFVQGIENGTLDVLFLHQLRQKRFHMVRVDLRKALNQSRGKDTHAQLPTIGQYP
jgi:hypothetical protein